MVEGARLESVYTRKGIAGSNPALSASKMISAPDRGHLLFRGTWRACSPKWTGITNDGTIVPALIILFDAPLLGISEHRGAGVTNPALSAVSNRNYL